VKRTTQIKKERVTERRTIGLLVDEFYYDIPISYFKAVQDYGIRHGINVLYIVSKAIRSPLYYQIQANILYDLPDEQNVDGLIIASNLLGSFISMEELKTICHHYHPIPVVSIGIIIEGFPSVVLDNAGGMYTAVSHLIEVHGYKRIAYICGPKDHPDAKERFQAYERAMTDHGLQPDEDLILPGDFEIPSGQKSISLLIDERNKIPGKDVRALVTSNDYMAFGALIELQKRGYRIPEDIAVVGFDDIISTQFYDPTLSTVHQSFHEMGRRAAELLVSLLNGEKVPDVVKIPATYVERQSCGCPNIETYVTGKPIQVPADVTAALHADPKKFLQYLHRQIFDIGLPRKYLTIWNEALSLLRRRKEWEWGTLAEEQAMRFGENAWSVLGMTAYNVFRDINKTMQLVNTATDVTSTLYIKELMNILVRKLPEFGINRCYLALYEKPPQFTYPQKIPGWSRLILAFDETGRVTLPPEGLPYPTRQILPDNILKQKDTFRLVIEAIYFRKEQIGFWLLDNSSQDEKIYPILTKLISSSLQGALLLKRYEERSLELAAANKEIRDLNEQLKDENLRIRTEMEVARHIQVALLPEKIRTIHPDFQIAARMVTAAEVGGDYYDISLDRQGTLWLGIGDVSGHGVTAGLIMMMAQTVHTTITTNYQASASDIVVMVNNVLFKNVSVRMGETLYMTFTTLKYLGNGSFQYAGSHLDILIYRQRTRNCELIETEGTWLNIKPDIKSNTNNSEFTLQIGDVLVLFTDGLTEVFDSNKQLLDLHGFKEIVRQHAEKDVETMQDAVFNDVKRWCDGEPKDDMSLVVVRRIK
jgi:sigma-B regulation protein RsbU (phosphoserine phosphatase)